MDRNSIIGLLLIGVLIIGYSVYTQPSEEERKAIKHQADSIAALQKSTPVQRSIAETPVPAATSQLAPDTTGNDSSALHVSEQKFGSFSQAAQGIPQLYVLENDLLKLTISSKGGIIKSAELKKYKSNDGKPARLLSGDSSSFNLSFPSQNRSINSGELYFTSSGVVSKGSVKMISLKLSAGADRYVEYVYAIQDGSYLTGFRINVNNLNELIAPNATYLAFDWKDQVRKQEKSPKSRREPLRRVHSRTASAPDPDCHVQFFSFLH